jgi:hypothetical protein
LEISAMDDTCGQFDSLIARAGQLSTADAVRLEAHLAGCESCRELARLLQPVDVAIAFADTNASEPLADTHGDATVARQDHDLPETTTDRYRITGEVGRGGIGRVLRARDRVLDRSVALKELFAASDKTRDRFIREALITARLQHPSIVPVYDAGHRDGRFAFYAMKLVAGRPLDRSIAEASTLAQRLALLPVQDLTALNQVVSNRRFLEVFPGQGPSFYTSDAACKKALAAKPSPRSSRRRQVPNQIGDTSATRLNYKKREQELLLSKSPGEIGCTPVRSASVRAASVPGCCPTPAREGAAAAATSITDCGRSTRTWPAP